MCLWKKYYFSKILKNDFQIMLVKYDNWQSQSLCMLDKNQCKVKKLT